jgi:hypothetical protein
MGQGHLALQNYDLKSTRLRNMGHYGAESLRYNSCFRGFIKEVYMQSPGRNYQRSARDHRQPNHEAFEGLCRGEWWSFRHLLK